jgi:glycerol-3-phosphate cytidylyltransferase
MRVGFTCSTFDLLHAGHILMLKEAKAQCDYLIVGLQTDPTIDRATKNKPVQSITERFIQLEAVKYIDEIVVYASEDDLIQILKAYNIDVRILGEDYKDKPFTGNDLPIEVYFNKRTHKYSTTELRSRIAELQTKK